MGSDTKDKKFPVTEEREKELLSAGIDPRGLSEVARSYKKRLQEKSLEGMDDYAKLLYLAADYFGITSPDKRLSEKLKKSDKSCMRQRVQIAQYQRKLASQENLISEKENELNDCMICFEKRKAQMQETAIRTEKLEEERQEFLEKLDKNPMDESSAQQIARINAQLKDNEQQIRKYERERTEFASKIVENEYFVKEAKNRSEERRVGKEC
jgi:chromosome segregation ATPase